MKADVEQFMVRVTKNGQTFEVGPYGKKTAMASQRGYRRYGSDTQLLPYVRPYVFTANITCSLEQAGKLKALLDDAHQAARADGETWAGGWGTHPEPDA